MAGGTQGPASLIGQVVGGYRLERVLGKGATGAVFLGRWVQGERPHIEQVGGLSVELPEAVAVKVLILPWQLNEAERADFRARFLREAETQQQRLRHPHVVTVLAYGEDAANGLIYMAQPYLRGGTLAERLAAQTGPMPLVEAAALLGQLADGLDYAHRQGVIHRDIKPANVLLNEQGQAYLSDFSIVRLLEDTHTQLTATGQILGTPQYMAPEQLAGGKVGPAADMYGLGMVAYELVTGRPAFMGPSLVDVLRQQAQEAPPPPRVLRPDLPTPAEAALLKALSKRPEDRFTSADAFAEAFSQGVQGRWWAESAAEAAPTTVASTPLPTMLGSPPWVGGPMYAPNAQWPGTTQAPATPEWKKSGAWAAVVVVALLALVGAYAGVQALGHAGARSTAQSTATATSSGSPVATAGSALVPVGALMYRTDNPGVCDSQGGQWQQNARATQNCADGGLVISNGDCCALGIVALAELPGISYPSDYVAEVTVKSLSSQATAKLGLKFRQQSPGDDGQGRGGYAFLIDPNGQWQFNRYDPDGTRQILVQEQLSRPLSNGQSHSLDLVVRGSSFSVYLDGTLLISQNDSTYAAGFFCLAVEPGATVLFSHLALYLPPQ